MREPELLSERLLFRYHTDTTFHALCKLHAARNGNRFTTPGDVLAVAGFYDLLEAVNMRPASNEATFREVVNFHLCHHGCTARPPYFQIVNATTGHGVFRCRFCGTDIEETAILEWRANGYL